MPDQDLQFCRSKRDGVLFYFDHSLYGFVDILQCMTIFQGETLKSYVPLAGTKQLTRSV